MCVCALQAVVDGVLGGWWCLYTAKSFVGKVCGFHTVGPATPCMIRQSQAFFTVSERMC